MLIGRVDPSPLADRHHPVPWRVSLVLNVDDRAATSAGRGRNQALSAKGRKNPGGCGVRDAPLLHHLAGRGKPVTILQLTASNEITIVLCDLQVRRKPVHVGRQPALLPFMVARSITSLY